MNDIYKTSEDSYFLSEILKKKIPNLLKSNTNLKFLEIGCGSGIQLETALKLGIKKENIFSCDINPEVVKHCKNLGFNSIISDLFRNINGKYDFIIFNPPYLPEDEKEPKSSRIATTGGKLGSEVINKFLNQAKKHLRENGKIFLLTSSLTKKIDFNGYHKKLVGKKKLFFEEIFVWEVFV